MSLRGSGGELLRGAVTNYIQNLSDAHFPCHDDNVVDLWKMVLGKKGSLITATNVNCNNWNKKTCKQQFSQTNDYLYCISVGIF